MLSSKRPVVWLMAVGAFLIAGCAGTAAIVEDIDAGMDVVRVDAPRSDLGIDVPVDVPMDASVDVPVDVPVDAPVDVPFRCSTNADCVGNASGTACNTTTGMCVGCVTAPDSCAASQHCDPASQSCVAGCQNDMGCAGVAGDGGVAPDAGDGGAEGLRCDTTEHACVQCLMDDDCPAGMVCAGEVCVPGCNGGHTCPAGLSCCTEACVDEVINAGNCGGCGTVCAVPNATPTCFNAQCAVGMCTAPFADCDHTPANGCEVNTLTDVGNCGGCGMACPARPNTVPSCVVGVCTSTCLPGFANCDGDPTNGCETAVSTDPSNCGACGTACSLPYAVAACMAGMCTVASCAAGHGNCDGVASNGCELDLTSTVDNCGTCDHACTAGPNAVPLCAGGACATTCVMGYQDCNGIASDGCEVNIVADPSNCGGCGAACAPPHATGVCAAGRCSIGVCAPGYADCDGLEADGCEVNLQGDPANCGACGMVCTVAGGTPACLGGGCSIGACTPGLAHCAATGTACETNIATDPNNCGGCGSACALPNATAACAMGMCAIAACNPGYGDCNGIASDGCETNLTTTTGSCGACGTVCSPANATGACMGGACTIAACNGGFADCDGIASNGCEANLGSDPTHCGSCGAVCALAHATQACASGRCVIGGCNPGYTNCSGNPADGCSVNTAGDPANCGGCGRACALPQVSADGCAGGACTVLACQAGYGNCDGAASNGCEANLATDPSNCGGCGVRPTQTCDLADDNCSGICEGVAGCRTAVARSDNHSTGEHFYTTSPSEAASPGFTVETYSAYYVHNADVGGTVPWYRCLMNYGKHLYTTSPICEGLVPGHVESVMGYVLTSPSCEAIPLYRSYNPSNNDHFFTTSYAEHVSSLSGGYNDEGIGAYVWGTPQG